MTTEEYSEYVWTTFKVQSLLWNFTCKNGQFSNYDELIKTQDSYQKAFLVWLIRQIHRTEPIAKSV